MRPGRGSHLARVDLVPDFNNIPAGNEQAHEARRLAGNLAGTIEPVADFNEAAQERTVLASSHGKQLEKQYDQASENDKCRECGQRQVHKFLQLKQRRFVVKVHRVVSC